jgi:hypothetical protein
MPVDSTAEYLDALTKINGTINTQSALGRVVGTAAGVVVGCPLGAVTGGALTILVPVLTPVGIVGGCILGAGTLGSLGGVVGSVITAGPSLPGAVNAQYQHLHSEGLIAESSQNSDGSAR